MNNSLVRSYENNNNNTLAQSEWDVLVSQAKMLVESKMLPAYVDTYQKAVVIILQGRELGIAPIAALNNITVIQGKATVSPQLMLALINKSGELEDFDITDDGKACKVTMKRRRKTPHTETFSQDDAVRMRLAAKPNWQVQPQTMRKWRAVAACARIVFPDVIMGFYSPEELGADVSEDGEFVSYNQVEANPYNVNANVPQNPNQDTHQNASESRQKVVLKEDNVAPIQNNPMHPTGSTTQTTPAGINKEKSDLVIKVITVQNKAKNMGVPLYGVEAVTPTVDMEEADLRKQGNAIKSRIQAFTEATKTGEKPEKIEKVENKISTDVPVIDVVAELERVEKAATI